jgi:hypothetical protein
VFKLKIKEAKPFPLLIIGFGQRGRCGGSRNLMQLFGNCGKL